MPEIGIDFDVRIYDSSNNFIWSENLLVGIYSNYNSGNTPYGTLSKNTQYIIEFIPNYEGELFVIDGTFEFTTRKGTETLGFEFNAEATNSYSYSLNMNYVGVRNFIEYQKDSSGNVINFDAQENYPARETHSSPRFEITFNKM